MLKSCIFSLTSFELLLWFFYFLDYVSTWTEFQNLRTGLQNMTIRSSLLHMYYAAINKRSVHALTKHTCATEHVHRSSAQTCRCRRQIDQDHFAKRDLEAMMESILCIVKAVHWMFNKTNKNVAIPLPQFISMMSSSAIAVDIRIKGPRQTIRKGPRTTR